jgi:hypothetical protein
VGDTVSIRLDKDGFEPLTKEIKIAEDRRALSFALTPALGRIVIEGVPRRAVGYLDDAAVDADKPLPTRAGQHRLRLELDQTVLISRTVEVRAGAETKVDVARERRVP